jgi:hypothetical protein
MLICKWHTGLFLIINGISIWTFPFIGFSSVMLGLYFVCFGVAFIAGEIKPFPAAISNDIGFYYHIKGRIFFSWFLAFLTPYFFVASSITFALMILESVFLTSLFAMSFHPDLAEQSYRIQEASGMKVVREAHKSNVTAPIPTPLTTAQVTLEPATTVVIDLPAHEDIFVVDHDDASSTVAAPSAPAVEVVPIGSNKVAGSPMHQPIADKVEHKTYTAVAV